ncbi:Uma2 family endonuclease [Catenulispora yoronensis]|uniref:Uma2 family endonuclease n=1 Tax=Catenulispora yoronensis TaxID=450799 RepID=A0ABN2V9Q7_9ACTN
MKAVEDRDVQWILQAFLELEANLPEGLRAELIDGEIVLVPPADGTHENVVTRISRQIMANCPDIDIWTGKGIETPRGRFIPDLVAGPVGFVIGMPSWAPADGFHLVVEVTCSRPDDDRHAKRLGYAEAGIPLYLLVDRERGDCVLRAEPENGDYRAGHRVPIGEAVPLPQPFGFALVTDSFLR